MKNKIDKQALREKIQGLSGLSNEDKSQLLALLAEQKKYGLVWEDSTEEAEEVLRENIPVLREIKEKAILNSSPLGESEGAPNHILIEGDNLHALTALTYTHEGKVDVIYIDPPYNTGNKDFVYNDSFVDSEDSYRHSKWLSFMERRLRIAKKLLSDKGVIFISIDDNEQANLKLLCDEMFGEKNFLANMVWQKKYTIANDANYFSNNHDHILVYGKNIDNFNIGKLPRTEEMNKAYKNPDNHPKGPWKSTPLHARSGSESSKNFHFEFPNGVVFTPPVGTYPRYSNERLLDMYNNNEIYFGKDGHSIPSRKTFLCDLKSDGIVPHTFVTHEEAGHNHEADEELKDVLGSKLFTSPKPTKLIKYIFAIANCSKDSLIFDFFAGSGTTLHATMQLNAEDGGHRQCILVTNNENNICEEVTYERNKRVINGYTTPKGVEVEGLKANNLRYYKTDFIPRTQSNANKHALMNASTDLLCIKEDLYEEVKPFAGLNFKSSVLRYFCNSRKQMLVVYNERAIEHIVPKIKEVATKDNPLKIYVFSDGAYAYDDEFHEVKELVELCALPDAIYQAYMRVLPPKRYAEEDLAESDNAEIVEAINDEYEYSSKEGGMA